MSDGNPNYKKYINSLDYSLDQIKLREVYEKVYRRMDFSFTHRNKLYSPHVINVTFKYSVCEWNRIGKKGYVKRGYCERRMIFDDGVSVLNGELVGILLGKHVEHALPPEQLEPYFKYDAEHGTYELAHNPKSYLSTAATRKELYQNGFLCDGVHYIRWKRSGGSSRVGKCLFINDAIS